MPGPGARGDVALVPFVHRCHEDRSQPGEERGAAKLNITGIERRTPPAEHEQREHSIANDVPRLAQVVMKHQKVIQIDISEKVSQQVVQHASGVVRGKNICGFKGDDGHPGKGGPPGAGQIGAGRGQG